MFAIERQNEICRLIESQGAVTVLDLVKRFSVSLETIRRDLLFLEEKGQLSRVHGGAVKTEGMKPFSKLFQRMEENERGKDELSKAALEFINQGDIISIDSGSTAVSFAKALRSQFSKLTVITHSLDVFEILHGYKDFSVILLGGILLESEKAFYGELTLGMLNNLYANKAFIFPSAVSIKYGICDYQHELCQMQKGLLTRAEKVYILADSSKFEKHALVKLADMKSEYIYITDSGLAENLSRIYRENNLNVLPGRCKNRE